MITLTYEKLGGGVGTEGWYGSTWRRECSIKLLGTPQSKSRYTLKSYFGKTNLYSTNLTVDFPLSSEVFSFSSCIITETINSSSQCDKNTGAPEMTIFETNMLIKVIMISNLYFLRFINF